MRLDVGPPSEKVPLNGNLVEVRDYIGLLMSTDVYAKSSCGMCMGRGNITTTRPISTAYAKRLMNENPGSVHTSAKRGNLFSLRSAQMCLCAKRRYKKAHAQLAEAFVHARLAKYAGFRLDADGDKQQSIELL